MKCYTEVEAKGFQTVDEVENWLAHVVRWLDDTPAFFAKNDDSASARRVNISVIEAYARRFGTFVRNASNGYIATFVSFDMPYQEGDEFKKIRVTLYER